MNPDFGLDFLNFSSSPTSAQLTTSAEAGPDPSSSTNAPDTLDGSANPPNDKTLDHMPHSPSSFLNDTETTSNTEVANQPLGPPPDLLMTSSSGEVPSETTTSTASTTEAVNISSSPTTNASLGAGNSTPASSSGSSSTTTTIPQNGLISMPKSLAVVSPESAATSRASTSSSPLLNNTTTTSTPNNGTNSSSSNSNSSTSKMAWQSESDLPHRRLMIAKIVNLLQQRKPEAPNEWLKKLPDMARRLEDSLYRTASSIDDYSDFSTLKVRLQKLAMTMGAGARPAASRSSTTPMDVSQPLAMPPDLVSSPSPTMSPQDTTSSALLGSTSTSGVVDKVLINAGDINPSLSTSPNSTSGSSSTSTSTITTSSPQRRITEEEHRQILRQQQQRLLLLRHASKCQELPGKCIATTHCTAMKKLWEHLAHCKDQVCKISHCVSSRYVLSHYHRCKDAECKVCKPVRDAIQKHHDQSSAPQMTPQQQQLAQQQHLLQQQQRAAQSQLMSQMQAMKQHAATMTPQKLMHQAQVTRQQLQIVHQQTNQLNQNVQFAVHLVHSASPRSKPQRVQEANIMGAQLNQSRQKLGQLQAQFQVLAQVLKEQQASDPQHSPHLVNPQTLNTVSLNKPLEMPLNLGPTPGSSSSSSSLSNTMTMNHEPPDVKIKEESVEEVRAAQQKQRAMNDEAHRLTPELKHKNPTVSSLKKKKSSKKDNTSDDALVKQESPDVQKVIGRPKFTPGGTSMLAQFTTEQIQIHLDSLQRDYCSATTMAQLKTRLTPVLKKLMDHEFGWVFNTAVDPQALGIPDYFKIVKYPMDLGLVKKKIEANVYRHAHQFARHVRQVFENAMLYNEEHSDVHSLARDMLVQFNDEFKVIEQALAVEADKRREGENACHLCGGERFLFEPLVFYCNGTCQNRIRRNHYYYTSVDNKYHWCSPCYGDLTDDQVLPLGEKTTTKALLTKKKNDEVNEESWVQCDKCNRWVHQICALFNGRMDETSSNNNNKSLKLVKNKDEQKSGKGMVVSNTNDGNNNAPVFYCPSCLLTARKIEPEKVPLTPPALDAADLPTTNLSDFIEARVKSKLARHRAQEARESKHKSLEDIPTATGLVIRQVSNVERQLMVRHKMHLRYRDTSADYTAEFRYRSKCLCMFQTINGVSVLLFGMYVHEYNEDEPEPNRRRVYVSYLDSVQYFEPRHLRTVVYQEILMAYLAFVKQQGFHTAHIWACPPLKGDDYILYCHPEDQKTPKSDRLRQWYVTMLLEAQSEGIVTEVHNIYATYWKKGAQASSLPYFEGDYWVGIAEGLIKDIEEEEKELTKKKGGLKSPKSKSVGAKKNSSKAKGQKKSSKKNKSKKKLPRVFDADDPDADQLMVKLGQVLEPMKDDFIVAKLQHECSACHSMILSGQVWVDSESPATSLTMNPEHTQFRLCDTCYGKKQEVVKPERNMAPLTVVSIPEKCTDKDEIMENEFFDTRQAFLSLCQGNHYQFDQLRRAQHTSLMVLYHLHNPTAPAYIYVCNHCQQDIASGNRYHCDTCHDFDICDSCHGKSSSNSKKGDQLVKHEHPLVLIPVREKDSLSSDAEGQDVAANSEARMERKRSIQLHMQLLVHSSACSSASCPSANCSKMKALLKHGATCTLRATGGCHICRRIWALLQIHARQCRQNQCPVPRCKDLKEHLRRLQQQQQQMDDRRRAAVTDYYRQQHTAPAASSTSAESSTTSTSANSSSATTGGHQKGGQMGKLGPSSTKP